MMARRSRVAAINFMHIDRRPVDDRLLLDDYAWLLHINWLLRCVDRLLSIHLGSSNLRSQWGGLESGDEGVTHPLLVKCNDVCNFKPLLDSFGLQLGEDDRVAHAAARHVDYVSHRHSTCYPSLLLHGLLLYVGLLLLAVVVLLLNLPLSLDGIVLGSADQASGDSTNCPPDQHPFGCFIVLFANDSTDDCTGDSAQRGTILGPRLGV